MSEHQYWNTLAIDTATMHLRLALSFGGDRQIKSDNLMDRTHGQVLFKKIDELFQSAGLDQQALKALVVCIGARSQCDVQRSGYSLEQCPCRLRPCQQLMRERCGGNKGAKRASTRILRRS